MTQPLYAAIEAGGTKFVCALGTAAGEIVARGRIPTTTPDETLAAALGFFKDASLGRGDLVSAGIASFGPLDLDPASLSYGGIVSTPKPGWSDFNILDAVTTSLGVPARIDTDVNCAALAEGLRGAARGCDTHAYVTVGTGIGVGLIAHGRSLTTRSHPEMGHIRVPRAAADAFRGRCPYHGDCLEGLACGPAMADRWSVPAENLPEDHPAWDMQAHYIAALCNTLVYSVRPDRIVIGGGVFERASLYGRVRGTLKTMLGDYALSEHERDLDTFITPPGLTGTPPGLLGALELARQAGTPGPGTSDAG